MDIKTQLSEKDFIKVTFLLLYKKNFAKVITAIAIFVLIVSIILRLNKLGDLSFTQIIFPIAMMIWLPLLTYFSAKKSFKSNKRVSEVIEYKFEKDFLDIKGESFSAQLSWDKIYKVSKTKSWVLIWQNSQIANVIPRRDLWEGQMMGLKEVLNNHKVKNDL